MKKQAQVTTVGALLLIAFAVGVLIYNEQRTKEITETANKNASVLVRDYSPTIGNADAKVTIVEFFDPACETCKAFYPFVKQLMAKHPGKIQLVLRYAPFHKGSDYVIKILEAARMQNKFWETLEATYEAQPNWAAHHNPQPEKLWMLLGRVGLNMKKAQQDMQSPEISRRIQQDLADASTLGVTKTPGFFVNGKPLVRFGYEPLQQLVDMEVRNSY
jgi:protein-disulfide isomerase